MIEKGRWMSHKVYKDILKFCDSTPHF
ncbi:MAG: hypothetical protein DSZ11_01860 [Sulfurovum sp.]|nr:MAG: hypothetical protein DSZ11_01860 [Sulfurovum sp.]